MVNQQDKDTSTQHISLTSPHKDPSDLTKIKNRGSIEQMSAYLGSLQLSAEEFVKLKPQVPVGLLKALGLQANAVPLPTENPATFLKTAVEQLVRTIDTSLLNRSEFVVVGTESIIDGSLPLSNHVLEFIPTRHLLSSEQKHACIATMNAIWDKSRDTGIIASTDIAHYGDDENTASSAEFTGGAGSIAIFTCEGNEGKLLDILDIKGLSSSLTYDFYKPYDIQGNQINAKNYPIVFGKYSNLANYERVTDAYLNLKENLWRQNTDFSLVDISGIVLHTPYPGITKYNLALMSLVDFIPPQIIYRLDQPDILYNDELENFNELQKGAILIYQYISTIIRHAHKSFENQDMKTLSYLENEVKEILRDIIKGTDNSPAISILGATKGIELMNEYHTHYTQNISKLTPSLRHISEVGNIYTGSSPLCMMSWLENANYEKDEYILWGGYGSGNQAIFMIAKTKELTQNIANDWNTQQILADRVKITHEEFSWMKSKNGRCLNHIIDQLSEANYISEEVIGSHLLIPAAFYVESTNQFLQSEFRYGANSTQNSVKYLKEEFIKSENLISISEG